MFKKSRIAALDHTTPARKRVSRPAPDGCGVITERIPWQPYLKFVKPSGAVSRVPAATHRANREYTHDPYRMFIEYDKMRKGFIPYGQCPQTLPWEAQQWLPTEIRGRQPCRTSVNGTPITPDSCCQCIEELIVVRKAAQRDRMEKIEFKTEALQRESATNDLAKAVKDIAGVVTELKKDATPAAKRSRNNTED